MSKGPRNNYIPSREFHFMQLDEFEVPKEIKEFFPKNAEETFLGNKRGAKKQYRYGKLHFLEYDDKFLVHMDKVDPRVDPIGHLVYDTPEVLAGLACAVFGAIDFSSIFNKNSKPSLTKRIISSLAWGYIGYCVTKEIKKLMR